MANEMSLSEAIKKMVKQPVAIRTSLRQSFAIRKNASSIDYRTKMQHVPSKLRYRQFLDTAKAEYKLNEFFKFIRSHLPPSQGGKYSGFGYTKDPIPKSQSHEMFDTTVSSLATVSWIAFFLNFWIDLIWLFLLGLEYVFNWSFENSQYC